jgi:hypothetical protein
MARRRKNNIAPQLDDYIQNMQLQNSINAYLHARKGCVATKLK